MPRLPWIAALTLGAAGAAALAYGAFVAPWKLRIYRREVRLPRLPDAFNGYRILHMSDLHLGALASGDAHALVAATIEADLVAVTGDMIEYEQYVDQTADLLARLSPRDGVFCILGNHDHTATQSVGGPHRLMAKLAERGVRTLVNESLPLQREGEALWLVGVDDPYAWRADVKKAFEDVPQGAPVIFLAHSPDVCALLPRGRADLVLTGHCHGGQVRTPFGAVFTRTRNDLPDVLGLQSIDGMTVHMSGGLGATIPLRILCPPELTVLHLVTGSHASAISV